MKIMNKLDELLNKLVNLRDTVGKNAGFANYRDYMFAAMGRFDYTPQDCFNFHESVKKAVVPLLDRNGLGTKRSVEGGPAPSVGYKSRPARDWRR